MTIFDYIWFRIARLYYKRDSDGITASAFLSLSQGIFVGDLIQIIVRRTGFSDSFYHSPASKIEVVIIICLFIFNYFNYRKKYRALRERWKEEGYSLLKGLLVTMVLIMPLVLWYILVGK